MFDGIGRVALKVALSIGGIGIVPGTAVLTCVITAFRSSPAYF
jgi:hypothetical protein